MRTRIFFPIVLASFLTLGLFAALTGQAISSSPDFTLTTADGLALTLSADGQVLSLTMNGDALPITPGPALWVRDMSQAGQVISPNLVANPGFEAGLDDWAEALNQGLDIGVVVSPTHSGDHALAFTNTLATTRVAGYASKLITVTPGQRYRLSAWFLSSTGYVTYPMGTPPMMQMKIWQTFQAGNGLYVAWLDGNGAALGQPQLVAPLHTEAAHWRLIRGEVTAPANARRARAILGARISDQTLWVDDVAFVPSPEPDVALTGIVAPCPGQDDCLQQTLAVTNGLAITVTYTAQADHIAVHGDIADRTGGDRALDVSWGVPLAAAGGTWWDDAHTSRPIVDSRLYANAISAIYDGWLPMSLYPYAGVQIANKGLALGLPLDRPQLALLSYDGASGRYGATYHLGISPQAVKVGPHATLDLMLYRFDPTWGFRDVIARHQKMQAGAYTTPRAQGLYAYQGRSQGQYYTPGGVHIVQQEDESNTYSAQYTSSDLVLRVARSEQPRPTMDDILHVLTRTLNSTYTESVALAQAITHSAAVDPNGDWSLKQVGIFAWDTDHWEAIWAGNVDPDIADGLASFLMDYRISRAFSATTQAGAHLDGVQIDNFMSNPTFDLRPEALAAADQPLSYTPHTYQPAVHTGYAEEEFLAYLRHYLDQNWGSDRAITINFWGLGHPNYLARYIDGFGSEGQLNTSGEGPNWNPSILDYRRALTAKRPYLFTIQASGVTASQAYTACQLALLYGVYPGHGPNGYGWDPAADQIISDTARLVRRYWAAGWEPLTYARADSEDVWVERFGSGFQVAGSTLQAENAELYFTIHNRSDISRTAAITIETAPLGLTDPAAAVLTDIAITQTIPFSLANGDIRFSLTLGPRQTRIVQVTGEGQTTPTPTPTPTPTATFTPTSTPSPTLTSTPTWTPTPAPSPTPIFPLYLPLALSQWHAPPTPPGQPASGPGGGDYPHASYVGSERGLGNGKYWVYQPADPRPDQAPVVVFLHGWGALTPNPYQFWLEHLVRKGNIVIYPKYQATRLTPTNTFTENAIGAVKDALDWLERDPGRVQPDRTKFAILGHSYGGTITVNMAHRWQSAGLPRPLAIMPVQPGIEDGGEGNIDPLSGIPSSTLMNCYVGNDDQVVGHTVCDIIWDRTGHIPAANRDYVVMVSDHHGEPGLDADHGAPLGGPGIQEVDALDWYGFWKNFDALRDCAFYGANCAFAVSDTPEHRFMGFWSDGTPVRELQITDAKP